MIDMAADIDTVFEWIAEGDSDYSSCRLHIYWVTWDTAIVIARNLSNNPGRSIADIAEKIVFSINHSYDLAPNKTMLIEYHSTDDSFKEGTYLQVLLTNREAVRYEIDKSKLVELIGKSI